jgi:hypothetical protein
MQHPDKMKYLLNAKDMLVAFIVARIIQAFPGDVQVIKRMIGFQRSVK